MPVQKQTRADQWTRFKTFVPFGDYSGHLGLGVKCSKKKALMMPDIDDCCTSAMGCTDILGNFAKVTFDAISKIYSYQTPDLWKETVFTTSPYQKFTDHLVKTHTSVSVQGTQAP
ncbi:hypothetical protein A6R68_11209, partial [Neotoma lepida]